MGSDKDLEDEWARANRAGRVANRQKAVATIASVAVVAPLVIGGYLLLYFVEPYGGVRIVHLALPWMLPLPVGLWVRRKLWPRGALGR